MRRRQRRTVFICPAKNDNMLIDNDNQLKFMKGRIDNDQDTCRLRQ